MLFYRCRECYKPNTGIGSVNYEKDMGSPIICPFCKKQTLEKQRHYKRRAGAIREARTIDEIEKSQERAGRLKRRPAKLEESIYTPEDQVRMAKRYKPTDDPGTSDDPQFAPEKIFDPRMRLTDSVFNPSPDAGCRDPRGVVTIPTYDLDSGRCTIGPGLGRKNAYTGSTMAKAFGQPGDRTLSAYTHANTGLPPGTPPNGMPYTAHKYSSLEWCHLVADSLGGETEKENLVAASFGANTFMLAIESVLSAKTTLSVQVIARCANEHIAEFIEYTVFKGNKAKTWTIDGRNKYFTKADYEKYSGEVKAFIK